MRVKANFPEFPPVVGFACTASFRSDAPRWAVTPTAASRSSSTSSRNFRDRRWWCFGSGRSARGGRVWRGHVFYVPGLRLGGAGHERRGRDLEQVRALKYPVFTGSTICSHGYCHMLHLGLPVRVGGLMVYQGDLLHADANGVTNIPPEIAADVAQVADEFIAAEALLIDYVKAPGEKSRAKYDQVRRNSEHASNSPDAWLRSADSGELSRTVIGPQGDPVGRIEQRAAVASTESVDTPRPRKASPDTRWSASRRPARRGRGSCCGPGSPCS
ncbi:MAG: hypothetical protein U0935_11450 [Pirellulales bacterium]